ncbi:2-amino-4-hydroxy-6-hydroxymethyldihydropteridine diphosphokinase [Candidatus Omnitrophota bacterium]
MSIVYLGIGSNIGERGSNCEKAVHRLRSTERVQVVARSGTYITKPVGGPSQDDYLNEVLKIKTDHAPETLLSILKDIEHEMGRKPAERNHPRVIDIDILLYDDKTVITDDLVIPHPRMHERDFVLKGLTKIAPDIVHPSFGKTVRELYEEI